MSFNEIEKERQNVEVDFLEKRGKYEQEVFNLKKGKSDRKEGRKSKLESKVPRLKGENDSTKNMRTCILFEVGEKRLINCENWKIFKRKLFSQSQ